MVDATVIRTADERVMRPLVRVKHGVEDDLDTEHEAIVAGVEDGTIPLEDDREPTPEEIEEAWGDLLLLARESEGGDRDDVTH